MLPLTVSASPARRAGADADAAVDGVQVAERLAGLDGDAAVDLVDVLRRRTRRRGAAARASGEGEGGRMRIVWGSVLGRASRLWMRSKRGIGLRRFATIAAIAGRTPAATIIASSLPDVTGIRRRASLLRAPQARCPADPRRLGPSRRPDRQRAGPGHAAELARACWRERPHTLIHTEGRHVGLPDGQMGNSEVGHMNLGAGRIVYQDLTRIDAAIEDGSFFANAELLRRLRRREGRRRHAARAGPAVARRRAQPRDAHLRDARTGPPRRRAAASPCTPSSTAATRRRSRPSRACARLQDACAQARQRAHRHASAAATTRWTATSAGIALRRAWDAIVDAQSRARRRRCAGRAARGLRARRERRVRRADRDRRQRADARRRRGRVHELPRRPRAPAHRRVRVAGLRRLRPRAARRCRASSA